MIKSLKAQDSMLADAGQQLAVLQHDTKNGLNIAPFQQKLEEFNLYPLTANCPEILQVNIGKMCNQACRHCHVDAGPDRKEVMTRETMQLCLDALALNPSLLTVDITGGAPELNPGFRWFVEEIAGLGRHIIVRCNLTILLANKKFNSLPSFYKKHRVEIISSLPFYTKERTDRQRGDGVFEDSITALQMLNAEGYGVEGSDLLLNLVYNPAGAFLPPSQQSLEKEYKTILLDKFGISFNKLFTITNLPVSRFLDYLLQSGNYEGYMEMLGEAYNPAAAANVMCRNTISVGWDGYLYDCDFNQMLELKIDSNTNHIKDFNSSDIATRHIKVGQHCFGCTAGAGSSCGGVTTQQ